MGDTFVPSTSCHGAPICNTTLRPRDVGIHAMELYFPKTYISQSDLGMVRCNVKGEPCRLFVHAALIYA